MTLKQIAVKFGVTLQAVHFQMQAAGLPRRVNDGANLRHPAVRAKSRASHPRGAGHPRYRDVPITEIMDAYAAGSTLAALERIYGVSTATIARRLTAEGTTLRPSGFHGRLTAPDGHVVESSWELLVDQWLNEHEIPHLVHPRLPFGRQSRADFLAHGHFIEIWGMLRSLTYASRREAKIANYERFGLKLVQMTPDALKRGDLSALETLLAVL